MPLAIRTINTKPIQLDFSSSGQGKISATALYFDENQFFNAIELLDFDGEQFQTQTCNCCGFAGCSSGSWVSIRRCDDYVMFIPAIEAMGEGKWEKEEYSPPYFLRKYGAPALSEFLYNELTTLCPNLPSINGMPYLSKTDGLAILQLEAPGYILGNIGDEVQLNREHIIAVSEGNLEDEISVLENLIEISQSNAEQRIDTKFEKKIEFILDLPNFPSWSPYGYKSNVEHLIIDIKPSTVHS